MDIHNYEAWYEKSRKRLENSDISAHNKKLILDYVSDLILKNLSRPRLMKYMEILGTTAKRLEKDFDKITETDLKGYISSIQQRVNYSPWTKQTYKVIIRRFYQWLHGMEGHDYPSIVKWINIRFSRSEQKLPSEGDLLTEEEVKKMIDAAFHPRDKAFVAIMWESGARIGEIGNITIKNISSDKYGVVLTLSGKTGSRKVRLIWSVPYLMTWLNCHPFKGNPDAPAW
ncbi:MAG: tyrosine-type recombinase/integrase, partial [Nanoarchaeota archaeon]|nr:tyrosine-type recombinase/integrase [Nanoarchaeota archaeon]